MARVWSTATSSPPTSCSKTVERVKITDFGLARAVDDSSVTQNGVLTGTPQYMAPEQARGEPVDQRADLFSLGSTLYAMCTGRSPFRADSSISVLKQVCEAEPVPIRSINPDIPAWLEGIIAKLHAKDPVRRFQSASEVADLLERCLAHVQQPDQHPLPRVAQELGRQIEGPRSTRLLRRWQLTAAAVAVLGLVALLWVILPIWRKHDVDTNAESASMAGASLNPALNEDNITQGLGQVRDRLHDLEQSFSATDLAEFGSPPLDRIRNQTGLLERDLYSTSPPSAYPVDAQLENIRRRLEQLKQDIGRRFE